MKYLPKALVDMNLISRFWSKYPHTWKYFLNIGLFLKYKTINSGKLPTYIRLPSSSNLHINPKENRGRALLISNGVTQERLMKFWEESVYTFFPTTVIDIGVNYGECLFSVRYPMETKIYGVEANEQLIRFILKSLAEHPNKRKINIIHGFASNREHQAQEFYIDKNWSGTSSGSEIYPQMVEKHLVRTITVDSLLSELNLSQEKILFKIDVEGYESFVLEGMKKVISESKGLLGIIEFDSAYIESSGADVDSFLANLASSFNVYLFNHLGELQRLKNVSLDSLQNAMKSKEIHTDLVLLKPEPGKSDLEFFHYPSV